MGYDGKQVEELVENPNGYCAECGAVVVAERKYESEAWGSEYERGPNALILPFFAMSINKPANPIREFFGIKQ